MSSKIILVCLALTLAAIIQAAPSNPNQQLENTQESDENTSSGSDEEIESYEAFSDELDALLQPMTRSRWTRFRDRVTKFARERLAAEAIRRAAEAVAASG